MSVNLPQKIKIEKRKVKYLRVEVKLEGTKVILPEDQDFNLNEIFKKYDVQYIVLYGNVGASLNEVFYLEDFYVKQIYREGTVAVFKIYRSSRMPAHMCCKIED